MFSREPAVERIVAFAANFITSQSSHCAAVPSGGIKATSSNLSSLILRYLLEHTNASSKAVRFRACQILATALRALPDDAALSDGLWDSLQKTLLQRAFDKIPRVRAAAATALCRLQTTGNPENDAVSAALLGLLQADSSSAVRKAALTSIAVCEDTIPAILRRTRDIKDEVRRAAYSVLALKLHPKDLSVEVRVELLRSGLKDRVSSVRKVCAEELLVAGWLEGACESNLFGLIDLLGGSAFEEDVILSLKIIFSMKRCSELAATVQVDIDNLTPADVLILRAMSDVKACIQRLEEIIPSVLIYTEILKYYSVDEFASRNLLSLSRRLDLSDEAGRKALEFTIRSEFLTNREVPELVVIDAVAAMRSAMFSEEAASRVLVEIILQDLMPLAGGDEVVGGNGESCDSNDKESRVKWVSTRALTISKALLRDFTTEQSNSTIRDNTSESKKNLSTNFMPGLASANKAMLLPLIQQAVLPLLTSQDGEQRRDALECLALFCLLDARGDDGKMHLPLFVQASKNDTIQIRALALQILADFVMLFNISDTPGAKASRNEQSLHESMPHECQGTPRHGTRQLSSFIEETKGTASAENFRVSTARDSLSDTSQNEDRFVEHSDDNDEFFSADGSPSSQIVVTPQGKEQSNAMAEQELMCNETIALLCTNLTSAEMSLRTVAAESLARLLFSRRINADPKLLSKLVLAYYNPVNEDNDLLRQCLTVFFPAFAFSSPYHRVVLESAFCPTLRILLDAPKSSPLSFISKLDVAQYMLHLTNPASVPSESRRPISGRENCFMDIADAAGSTHERIAESLLTQLVDSDDESETDTCKLYARVLASIRLSRSNGNEIALQRINKLARSVSSSLLDKRTLSYVEKFQKHVSSLLQQ